MTTHAMQFNAKHSLCLTSNLHLHIQFCKYRHRCAIANISHLLQVTIVEARGTHG